MSRPNVFVLWPALLAITIQINQGAIKKVNWKEVADGQLSPPSR